MLRSSLSRIRARICPSPLPPDPAITSSSAADPSSFNSTKEQRALAKRVTRQRRLRVWVWQRVRLIRTLLIVLPLGQLLLLPLSHPSSPLPAQLRPGRSTYIDENALQPGQVNTYWGWEDVKVADEYLKELETVWDESELVECGSESRASYLLTKLNELNIPASTQEYAWTFPLVQSRLPHSLETQLDGWSLINSDRMGKSSGRNVIATISPPRSSGAEVILLTIPWISLLPRSDPALLRAPARPSSSQPSRSSVPEEETTQPNLRGIALALAFARFLRGQNHWAKEIVLVFGDGDVEAGGGKGGGGDGVAAWLAEWSEGEREGLTSTPLRSPPQGSIWTALSIDYPGHSFSRLGVFHEGVNGALPNQDWINTVVQVGRSAGVGVEVGIGREEVGITQLDIPAWVPSAARLLLQMEAVQLYARGVRHLSTHFMQAAFGKPAGAHGVYAKYKIDGFTLLAEPSTGPHGFHAFGILLESSLRSSNNLLERLHASFFFYLMPCAGWFIPVGGYLPAAIMLGASLTVGGLGQWVDAGWMKEGVSDFRSGGKDGPSGFSAATPWRRVDRATYVAVTIIISAFAAGRVMTWAATTRLGAAIASPGAQVMLPVDLLIIGQILTMIRQRFPIEAYRHKISQTTSALTHILAGAGISSVAMIKFPQALLASAIAIPTLALTQTRGKTTSTWSKALRLVLVLACSPANLTLLLRIVRGSEAASRWQNFTAALLRDRVILGRGTLDAWLGVIWPIQLLASVCVLLGR